MIGTMKIAATLSTILQLVSAGITTSSIEPITSPSPTAVISVTTADLGKPFHTFPGQAANPKCQCNQENGVAEIADGLEKVLDNLKRSVEAPFEIFNLPLLISNVQGIFENLNDQGKDIRCFDFKAQSYIFGALDQVLDILHQLLEGVNSSGLVQLANQTVPGLQVINDGISGLVVSLNGGLTLQPCCIFEAKFQESKKSLDEWNTIIDSFNAFSGEHVPHVSNFSINDNIIHNCSNN